jgi:hypothetical protein
MPAGSPTRGPAPTPTAAGPKVCCGPTCGDRESVPSTGDPRRRRVLAGRRWFQMPDGTDPVWRAYWNGARSADKLRGGGPVVRTVHECLQAVLWSGTIGLMPLVHVLPEGLTSVALIDMPPSRLVVAWNEADTNPLVRSFVHIAEALYGRSPS